MSTRTIQPYARASDKRLCYGPCCHDDELVCLCRRFGETIRSLGFHPIPSQRKRDVVCLVLNQPPGSLVPVISARQEPGVVQLWDTDALARGELVLVHVMTARAWGAMTDVMNDGDYAYQPETPRRTYRHGPGDDGPESL